MSKSKLLQEAIADAKAVKETALANAKAALTEAFTPKLQSMISAKLQQEMDDEDMEGAEDEMYEDEDMDSEETDVEDLTTEDDEMDSEEDIYTEDDEMGSEEFNDEDDLELEAIIRELEDEDMESDEETNEDLDSLEIGDGDNAEPTVDTDTENDDDLTEEDEDEESEIDINEIIRALREDDSFTGDGTPDGDADEESREEEAMAENKKLRKDLTEAYKAIKKMKTAINETNLLNAKLLFSNKLFKSYDLTESQKLKVIDNFDRANTLREVKLVYTTLAESMRTPAKRKMNESASRVVGSTAPKKQVINEGVDFKQRLQKLAGLKK